MNLTLKAECIVYVPNGHVDVVTLVNPDQETKDAVRGIDPWKTVDTLTLMDKKATGELTWAKVQHLWFIDAEVCNSTADVLMVRFVSRPEIGPITSEPT